MSSRWLVLPLLLLGCGSNESTASPASDAGDDAVESGADTRPPEDSGATDGAPGDTSSGCMRAPAAEDRTRYVVVSHPFDAAAKKTGAMEVLELSADGALTRVSKTFSLAAASFEPLVFTPDGKVGFAPLDDGAIGAFRLEGADPVVVHAGFKGSFYAQRLVMDPSGDRLWVVDGNTLENGGGIHALDIACDGALTYREKLVAAKTWSVFAFFHGDPTRAIASGGPGLGAPETVDTHLLEWKAAPSLVASTLPFGDRDAMPSWLELTPDNQYALIAENGILEGSRVAVVSIGPKVIAPLQIFTTDNPVAVVASPFGNSAVVLNSDGKDGFTLLRRDGASMSTPFTNAGKLAYVHGRPQLPSSPAMIARGKLRGRVLISENVAVRQLQFNADGSVTDVSKLAHGSGYENIVGSLGVQP